MATVLWIVALIVVVAATPRRRTRRVRSATLLTIGPLIGPGVNNIRSLNRPPPPINDEFAAPTTGGCGRGASTADASDS